MKNTKTILYAEDDAVTLIAYKNRLEQMGYTVQAAADGLEALRSIHHSPPDLLLLDLMLPRLNGEDVLKYLNLNPSLGQIPVIVLSTNSILTAANEPLVEKADKHLLKHDCTFAKLVNAIEEVLSAKQTAVHAEAPASPKPAVELLKEIEELNHQPPVVCAWTDRIKIEDQWLNLTEFLSKRLHLQVTHGVSPEGVQQFFGKK